MIFRWLRGITVKINLSTHYKDASIALFCDKFLKK